MTSQTTRSHPYPRAMESGGGVDLQSRDPGAHSRSILAHTHVPGLQQCTCASEASNSAQVFLAANESCDVSPECLRTATNLLLLHGYNKQSSNIAQSMPAVFDTTMWVDTTQTRLIGSLMQQDQQGASGLASSVGSIGSPSTTTRPATSKQRARGQVHPASHPLWAHSTHAERNAVLIYESADSAKSWPKKDNRSGLNNDHSPLQKGVLLWAQAGLSEAQFSPRLIQW